MAMTDIDFAALGLVDDASIIAPTAAGGTADAADPTNTPRIGGSHRRSPRRKKKGKSSKSRESSTSPSNGGFGTGGLSGAGDGASSPSGRSKKKGAHRRAHRRSTAVNDSASNLDFLNELETLEVKKPSTRGLRNHVNQVPVSYDQPAWMQYKQRAMGADAVMKKTRRSNGGTVYELSLIHI